MFVKDLEWKAQVRCDGEDTLFSAFSEIGRFTVLDRLTGFHGYIRDIETGYKDNEGLFWLASGDFDIRKFPELSLQEAIALIKKESNTCIGV
jgi:hypothetical protein